MRTIVFKYTRDFAGYDVVEDEYEFEDDATDEEIGAEYAAWMISQVMDSCTWYEKDE